jgi:hypothetical protein
VSCPAPFQSELHLTSIKLVYYLACRKRIRTADAAVSEATRSSFWIIPRGRISRKQRVGRPARGTPRLCVQAQASFLAPHRRLLFEACVDTLLSPRRRPRALPDASRFPRCSTQAQDTVSRRRKPMLTGPTEPRPPNISPNGVWRLAAVSVRRSQSFTRRLLAEHLRTMATQGVRCHEQTTGLACRADLNEVPHKTAAERIRRPPPGSELGVTDQNLTRRPAVGAISWVTAKLFARPP